MKVAIAGATGLIGRALAVSLANDGHEVVVISRNPAGLGDRYTNVVWDPSRGGRGQLALDALEGPAALEGTDAVVNLAGESIAGRWTSKRQNELMSSRLGSTEHLVEAIGALEDKPKVFVGASAIGFYGNRGDEELTEDSPSGVDAVAQPAEAHAEQSYLTHICIALERAAQPLKELGVAWSHTRFGIVLAPQAPAFTRLRRLGRLGLLGPLGKGNQWWSWITLPDAVAALRLVIEANAEDGSGETGGATAAGDEAVAGAALTGPVNVCAPDPRRQREFVKVLASALRRPAFLPAPSFAIRAALGEMGQALLLESARVLPAKLSAIGFEFQHPTLEKAVAWLLDKPSNA